MKEDARVKFRKFGILIYEDLSSFPFVKERAQMIPYAFARQREVLPLEESGEGILVAMSNPLDFEVQDELSLFLKKSVRGVYASKVVLEAAIEQCYQQKEGAAKRLFSDHSKNSSSLQKEEVIEGYDLLDQADSGPAVRMVNAILLEAVQQGASDIHLEPSTDAFILRYRIDGMLQQRGSPPFELQGAIVTRIKIMAKMDIAENRLPQDGRTKLRHGGREIDFRISTVPTVYGERIVLRILDKGNISLGLEQIGMEGSLLLQFRKLIAAPEGIVLVTGPTGSGKTTTLYSALSLLNTGDVNIVTIEDPVEYKLAKIAQINVNSRIDLTFAKGLRHILRQDPDVIMIGEIRDQETAEIAVQASLTGHLVLSTLHTNDAPSAITRLVDMGVEPYLLSSSLLGVLAQRLLRRICPHCRIEYTPEEEELQELSLSREQLTSFCLFRGKGCSLCFFSGYKGRYAIYELMVMDTKLKAKILKSPDAQALRLYLRDEQKMSSLFDQGKELVLRGLTSSSELLRVTRLSCDET